MRSFLGGCVVASSNSFSAFRVLNRLYRNKESQEQKVRNIKPRIAPRAIPTFMASFNAGVDVELEFKVEVVVGDVTAEGSSAEGVGEIEFVGEDGLLSTSLADILKSCEKNDGSSDITQKSYISALGKPCVDTVHSMDCLKSVQFAIQNGLAIINSIEVLHYDHRALTKNIDRVGISEEGRFVKCIDGHIEEARIVGPFNSDC